MLFSSMGMCKLFEVKDPMLSKQSHVSQYHIQTPRHGSPTDDFCLGAHARQLCPENYTYAIARTTFFLFLFRPSNGLVWVRGVQHAMALQRGGLYIKAKDERIAAWNLLEPYENLSVRVMANMVRMEHEK